MHSLRKGKALKERDTGPHQVDQPLGQRQFLEELSILLEVEEEADQVGLEVGLTLSLRIPTPQEEDHQDRWDHQDQTQIRNRKELQEMRQEMRRKDKGKARSRTLRSSTETETKPGPSSINCSCCSRHGPTTSLMITRRWRRPYPSWKGTI